MCNCTVAKAQKLRNYGTTRQRLRSYVTTAQQWTHKTAVYGLYPW